MTRAQYAQIRMARLAAKIKQLEAQPRTTAAKKALASSRNALKRWRKEFG